MNNQSIHFDPEFETFTYGDPTRLKSSLKRLDEGSLLVFYAGLEGWDFHWDPALYIVGYFRVAKAGLAESFSRAELADVFVVGRDATRVGKVVDFARADALGVCAVRGVACGPGGAGGGPGDARVVVSRPAPGGVRRVHAERAGRSDEPGGVRSARRVTWPSCFPPGSPDGAGGGADSGTELHPFRATHLGLRQRNVNRLACVAYSSPGWGMR